MATEACVCNFTVWRYMKSLLVHTSFEATAIHHMTCCQGNLVTMATSLPWQQKHAFITWLFEDIWSFYLVHRSLEATAIHRMTCCYGNFVTMATEASFNTWLFENIWSSYLVHRSLEAPAIHCITCCYGNLVTMATETHVYIFAVWG